MILAYKKRYQTCLQMLDELRLEKPEFALEKLSYNGILDPMAEGIVPVLVGDEENKNRSRYTGSIKEYEASVLVGVSTDSGDLLGIVKENGSSDINDKIVSAFLNYPQEFEQTVPMHSNRKVRGKRLWWWILNGVEIPEEERPKNKVRIIERNYLGEELISVDDFKKEIVLMQENIGERFRIGLVGESWKTYFQSENVLEKYLILNFRLKVSSGFYVRSFVEAVTKSIGIRSVVFTLKRTKVEFKV